MKHCGTQTIETDRLILRRYTISDCHAMFRNWASDPEVTRFLTWPTHTSVDVTREVIGSWLPHYSEDNYYHWTITLKENGDEAIGDIAVVRQDESSSMAHVGYSLGKKWWHQGITSEALRAVMDYLFDMAGCEIIEARHDPDNPNSGKVMLKCGMKFAGMKHDPDMKKQGDNNACFYTLHKSERSRRLQMDKPYKITDNDYRFDSFANGKALQCRGPKRLPAMGWNSWNPFGSNNNEELTRAQVDKIIELGLDKFGYQYVVLDDGCYSSERVDGKLVKNEERFPGGLNAITDYVHGKGLKFGMYNDIGSNLCGGAAVGTHGHEKEDAESYRDWDIDYIKVDNCYYMFDNATFADPANARFSYAPNIKSIGIKPAVESPDQTDVCLTVAAADCEITGTRAKVQDGYVTFIGTFDGTAPDNTPIGLQSSEIVFEIEVPEDDTYLISVEYATGKEEGIGQWLQIRSEEDKTGELTYDDFLPETSSPTDFTWSEDIPVKLHKGLNKIRFMNHRRQENTLSSYATLLEEIRKTAPEKDIVYSICEWGKTMPSDWGYKVGDSWRILNDITFAVGSPEGDYGTGKWADDYTNSITSQYNKCVIMDEFASLERGWNDPDMLVIGMNGLTPSMNATHMSMWCMMNSPLMLGLDLRRIEKDDDIYKLITNKHLIGINQDPLGIQAKRVFTSIECEDPAKDYIRDINRIDVLAKPLTGGRLAVAVYNLSEEIAEEDNGIDIDLIAAKLGDKFPDELKGADKFKVLNVWTGDTAVVSKNIIGDLIVLEPCGNMTFIVERA